MKCRCPHCRLDFDLESVLADNDIVAAIKIMPTFGRHSNLVWAYLELFGIGPLFNKRKKLRVLLEEMRTLYESESFSFQRKKYSISKAGISEALNMMVHRNFASPLTNHNYLKQVMLGIAEREGKEASKQNERSLREKEDNLRSGIRRELTTEQAEQNRERIQGILKSIS